MGKRNGRQKGPEQHDAAEKQSEKVEAMKEVQRGKADENVLSHARIPHEGDSR